jgi:hypothetical protein
MEENIRINENISKNKSIDDLSLSSKFHANNEAINSSEYNRVKKSSMISLSDLFEKKLNFNELNLSVNEHLLIERLKQIEKDLMPDWNAIDENEKAFIHDLINKWKESIGVRLSHARTKCKELVPLQLDWKKMLEKGAFNFEISQYKLNKDKMNLFRSCCMSINISTNAENDESTIMRPNTRLILKAYKQLTNAFDFLQRSRSCLHDSNLDNRNNRDYWRNLSSFISSISKVVIRLLSYVQSTSMPSETAITMPPMHCIESDCVECSVDLPKIELETLHSYSHLCFNQLNSSANKKADVIHSVVDLNEPFECAPIKNSTKQRSKKRNKAAKRRRLKRANKTKYFRLIINSVIRMIRLCSIVKESLMMKQISYDLNFMATDVDIYAHYLLKECNLINEYLKAILEYNI